MSRWEQGGLGRARASVCKLRGCLHWESCQPHTLWSMLKQPYLFIGLRAAHQCLWSFVFWAQSRQLAAAMPLGMVLTVRFNFCEGAGFAGTHVSTAALDRL